VARWAALLFLLLAAAAGAPPLSAARQPAAVVISGGDLPGPVRLAPADADAFQRRLNQPPRFSQAPRVSGLSYAVSAPYWEGPVRQSDDEPPVEVSADYFPAGGFVRARQAGREVWIVIDLRQRELLDRYIRLAKSGSIPAEPGALEVAAAAARDEAVSISAGGRLATPAETQAFWSAFAASGRPRFAAEPRPPDAGAAGGYWLVFSLPEGRVLSYFYDRQTQTLTDSLGTEAYAVAPALAAALPQPEGPALEIEQQEPPGSLAWWPVMVGAGLASLALALWLNGRRDAALR